MRKSMLMKLAVAALVLTSALFATASSIDLTGTGGVLFGSQAGLTVFGMTLSEVGGTVGNLGTMSFLTSPVSSGDLQSGAALANGGAFNIVGNGVRGVHSGVLFTGTFTNVVWKLVTDANGNHFYDLLGAFAGTWFTGQKVDGAFSLLTDTTGPALFSTQVNVASLDATINFATAAVPEPSSLLYLGTGLIGLGAFRRFNIRKLISK